MIRFERFGWRFAGASTWALDDVSLHVRRGEFIAVIGPSGSGKSTLALAMCGLLVGRHEGGARGSVQVDGRDATTAPLHETAQTIALVQQNPDAHFATLTVEDEIAFGMENRCLERTEIRRRSAEALARLSIGHLRDRSLATLSGGEKQRVAVASIVAGDPAVIVLDEPTASLDPEASGDLFRTLANLCGQARLTVVVIEHKLAQLLPLQPRLIRLDEGRVAEDIPRDAVGNAGTARRSGPAVALGGDGPVGPARVLGEPVADVSGVTVELGGHIILEDVSLCVRAGETVAVMGPNGGGKSTLLQCLLGLIRPNKGSIRLGDTTVAPAIVSQLARFVGAVFQNADHQLVADTVWREALFAVNTLKVRGVAAEREATRLLEDGGLSSRTNDHPYRLSWGQKRRLNVISAILHRPRLLLLDEPFGGQDWENAAFLLSAIRGVLGEVPTEREAVSGNGPRVSGGSMTHPTSGACLMATHDARVVLHGCTRLLFMAEGRIAVDLPVPQAFDRLRELGREAYVPTGYAVRSAPGARPG